MKELSERDIQKMVGGIPSSDLVLFCPGLQGRGNTLIDRSQSANHGTMHDITWKRRPGGARGLGFNGSTSWVDCGNDASTQLQQFVAMAWAVLSSTGGELISHAQSNASGWHLTFNDPSDIYMGDNYVAVCARWNPSTINPADGKPHHWAFYRDADNLTGIICDGVERATLAYGATFGFGNLQLGRRSVAQGSYLSGEEYYPIIVGGTLSNAAIQALVSRIYTRQRHLLGV